jgi:hypothetical protein
MKPLNPQMIAARAEGAERSFSADWLIFQNGGFLKARPGKLVGGINLARRAVIGSFFSSRSLALAVVPNRRSKCPHGAVEYGETSVDANPVPSRISFSITKARFWNETTARYEGEATRSAHCYVFCSIPNRIGRRQTY